MMKDKLVEVFVSKFNWKKETPRKIGLEVEFPVVDLTGKAVSYSIIKEMFRFLETKGFELHKDATTSEIIYAREPLNLDQKSHTSSSSISTIIGTDSGYCTLEIALKPQDNLFACREEFHKIIGILTEYFRCHNCLILGYGIQPITPPSQNLITQRACHLMSQKIMAKRSAMNRFIDQREGSDLDFGRITAASQCHIDVTVDEAIRAANALNGLSGLQIALTANSPVWLGRVDPQWKAVREIFWEYMCVTLYTQVGIPKSFSDIFDYVEYLCKFPPLMIERQSQLITVIEKETFKEFLNSKKPSKGLTLNDQEIAVLPEIEDIITHSSFAWFNARLSPKYGTIESRISCQQPPKETILVPALILGLIENLEEAEELLKSYSWEEWKRLRYDSLRHVLQAQIDNKPVLPLVEKLITIAELGLRKRGNGEEIFLASAKRRIAERKVPANDIIRLFETMTIPEWLKLLAFN